jgi:hypothetical protein
VTAATPNPHSAAPCGHIGAIEEPLTHVVMGIVRVCRWCVRVLVTPFSQFLVLRPAAAARAAPCAWLELCQRVSPASVMPRSRICVLASMLHVLLSNQIVQCARIVGASAAKKSLQTGGAQLARHLGHGDELEMATWGQNKQCTCDVLHVAAVLEWAMPGYGGLNVLGRQQGVELAAAVQTASCDLARTHARRDDRLHLH